MIRYLSLTALVLLPACASVQSPPVVRVAISVDWEGREISEQNLIAFEKIRAAHPDVPLTQFINAAYFVKPDADAAQLREKMARVLQSQDELGLHIHPWRSLAQASGVEFRAEPTVWGFVREDRAGWPDPGHDVSVEAYTVDEFQAFVKTSKRILAENGFALSQSFRAGAWLAGPHVREAIRREGFVVDSSATDTKWHDEIDQYALPSMMREIWPDVTCETQPFTIQTPAGELLEMPDTGALADYITAVEMIDHIAAAVGRLDESGTQFVHIGFHLETSAKYGQRIIDTISGVKSVYGDQVIFETLEDSAALARKMK
ncbi:MAG: hypothetical protein HN405_10195 [Planctomycetes bacterium]|nr:hypothetical protein [Planctomycetota bacterium]MBT4560860.1 hypothetical protein [Planctomycetota bacterium]